MSAVNLFRLPACLPCKLQATTTQNSRGLHRKESKLSRVFFLAFPVFCMCVFFWKTHVLQCTYKNPTTTTHTARRVQTQPPRKRACRCTKGSTSTTIVQCPPAVAPPVTAQFTKPMPIMLHQNHQRNRHRLWSAPDAFASMGCRSAGAVQHRANPTSLLRCSSSIADCCNAFAKFLHA